MPSLQRGIWKQTAKSWRRRSFWVRDSRDKWHTEAMSARAFIKINSSNSFDEFRKEWHRLKEMERLVKDMNLLYPDRTSQALKRLLDQIP
jgi:hypothetical protein